ncbi:MAG: hypothetical protein R3C17_15110 [Planctomycetaceae bacterium]
MTSGFAAFCRWFASSGCVLLHLTLFGCSGSAPLAETVPRPAETVTKPAKTSDLAVIAPQTEVPEMPEEVPEIPAEPAAEQTSPARRFRLPDDRRPLNRDELLAEGLRVLESEHLMLVTDLPLESVANLPPLADALFRTLEQRLGKLTPDIAGKTFQVTGFLMDVRDRFDRAGLLPPEQYPIRHGRNLGYRFWMNNQTADYYRRHLLLHEFVHCFLMCEYGMTDIPPLWYTEGIAEYFATHKLHEDLASSEFGVLPSSVTGFEGWHRIAEIQRHFNLNPSAPVELTDLVPLQTVLHPPDARFVDDLQYAHAWALVWLINHHPELKADFADIAASRTRQQFQDALANVSDSTWQQLNQIWPLYLDGLKEAAAASVRFPAVKELKSPDSQSGSSLPGEFVLTAGQQWASTGLRLTTGQEIMIECHGRCIVEETTKPWFSEPDGITIDYVHGCPLGQVVGAIISEDGTRTTRRIPIGSTRHLRSPIDGILWLQINDEWSERDRNHGTVSVHITAVGE